MLDVFVDTFIVALVQLSPLMSVEPGPGVVYFMAVVVLTMFAAESFDPRLIWDAVARAREAPDWLTERPTTTLSRSRRGAAASAPLLADLGHPDPGGAGGASGSPSSAS